MNGEYFVITGPNHSGDNLHYWDAKAWRWTCKLESATKFDRRILLAPLPQGTSGIMKLSESGEPISFFRRINSTSEEESYATN